MRVTKKGLKSVGRQPYNFASALAELVDNAIAAGSKRIEIRLEQHAGLIHGGILDDGCGMSLVQLEDALNFGSDSGGGLNEHGVGMKQALSWFRDELQEPWDIQTKAAQSDPAYYAFDPDGDFQPEVVDDGPNPEGRPGTLVRFRTDLSKLWWVSPKQERSKNIAVQVDWLRAQFGALYRRVLLRPNPPRLFLYFDNEPLREITPVTPEREGNLHSVQLAGTGWTADLTIFRKRQSKKTDGNGDRYRMYSWTLANQGIDIIRADRVVLLHDMDAIGRERHNQYNWLSGELVLSEAFPTLANKSGMYESPAWQDLEERIRKDDVLTAVLGSRPNRTEKLSEEELQKKLQTVLEASFKLGKVSLVVDRDLDVETGGKIDLRVYDKKLKDDQREYTIIETKVDDVDGQDVYQAFRYADEYRFNGRKVLKIQVIGSSIKVRAERSAEIIKANHDLEVVLERWSDYDIETTRQVRD